jgi:hypothetical protein
MHTNMLHGTKSQGGAERLTLMLEIKVVNKANENNKR